MALENVEENQEKVNAAALSVIEDGAGLKVAKEDIEMQEGNQSGDIDIKEKVTKEGKFSIDIIGALSNVGSSATAFVQGVGS